MNHLITLAGMQILAAPDPPQLINTTAIINFLRVVWTVALIFAAFGLWTQARKAKYAEVLGGMLLLAFLSAIVYVPGLMEGLGNTISQYF